MATNAAIVTDSLPTTGSKTFAVSGFGTPTAAIIICGNGNTGTNPNANAQFSVGFWTASTQFATGIRCSDAQATTVTSRMQKTGVVVHITLNSSGSGGSVIAYSATSTTDGLSLSVAENSTTAARYCTVILISGTTNAYIGSQSLGTGTSAINVETPNFPVNFVAFAGNNTNSVLWNSGASMSFGVARKNSSNVVSQAAIAFSSLNSQSTATVSNTYVSGSACFADIASDAVAYSVAASDFDSLGFSLTPSASAGEDDVYYLALQFPDDDDTWIDVIDSSTGTGTTDYTGTGFTPKVVALGLTLNTAEDTALGSGSFGIGVASASTQQCLDIVDEDASGTSDAQSAANTSNIADLKLDTFAADTVAAVSAFGTNGFTLNYSDGSASVRKWLAFAFGDSTAASGAPTLSDIKAASITATTVQGTYDYAF